MKDKIALLITGCLMTVLTSCLNSSNEILYEASKNNQILTFSLKNDSVPGLDSLKFTIDQLANEVFNLDSMPVGTKMEKALCTMTYGPAVTGVRVYQEASGDTIDWNSEDSIDFSKPVRFIMYTGTATRNYDAWVNIHAQVPDSMSWSLYSDQWLSRSMKETKVLVNSQISNDTYYLYAQPENGQAYELYTASASNLKQWAQQTLEGLPASGLLLSQLTVFDGAFFVPAADGALYTSADASHWAKVENAPVVKAVLGGLQESANQPAVLSAVVEQDGKWMFATLDKEQTWTLGSEVPADFPVSGFAAVSMDVMFRDRLLVVGGRTRGNQLVNTSWSTMDARTWANLTDNLGNYFTKKEGASLAYYDDRFYLIGGIDEAGKANKDIHWSFDRGVTWSKVDTLVVLPDAYVARGYASALVDKDKFLTIFGGKTSSGATVRNEIWRGRVNRLGFARP